MPTRTAQPTRIPRRIGQVVLGLVFVGIGFEAWSRMRLSMSGAPRAALEQLRACEQARNLLGEDIDSVWWGWSHGWLRVPRTSQAWSAVRGSVDWTMPVAGSTGRGVLHFQGKKDGGFWELDGALEVDGVKVYTRSCEVSGGSSP
ncbi:cytochrome c oxidase assembly factor Coa1 family protein [Hyalangium gracile]|uniref:cytochrome c oxidase assembly factor Coa1 family protein n=1 Tax=Hyalangium gracile TaxID=394092 RepID=UPI001CCBC388|nr:cytochrome c oxidase assembly factor Coa1 family protein [Hyalangium gracile]